MSTSKLLPNTIEVLMAEWLTYKAVDLYRRGPYSWDCDSNYKTIPNEVLFSSLEFHPSACWFLSSIYMQLVDLKILKTKPNSNALIAGCNYKDIKATALNNISNLKTSNLHCIFTEEDVPLETKKPFTIEDGCTPMIAALEAEEYVEKHDSFYVWKNKFCELLGVRDSPKADSQKELFEIIEMELDQKTLNTLNDLAADNQKILAIDVVKKAVNITLKEAKEFIEDYMFSHIWGKPKRSYTLQWYKKNRPAPNRS